MNDLKWGVWVVTHHHLQQSQSKNPQGRANRRWMRRDALRGRFFQDKVSETKMDAGFTPSNNLYPSLFHSWPLRSGRIEKTVRALQRVERRRQFVLPRRSDYQSTVDLYEASLPVLKAIHRLGENSKSIAPVPSLSIRGMLKNLKTHLFF